MKKEHAEALESGSKNDEEFEKLKEQLSVHQARNSALERRVAELEVQSQVVKRKHDEATMELADYRAKVAKFHEMFPK